MNKPSSELMSLAIKNYRPEWTGLVTNLTQVSRINPNTESLADVETFNGRFQQLSQSIRHSTNALADIAIRDKKYLESFLTGYTNPLVTQTFKYEFPQTYIDVPTFDLNGNPIVYTEPRIMYSVTTIDTLDTTAVYAWVFRNGLLLDDDIYDIVNTAYGVKCFVKAEFVNGNDTINVVINRIYNAKTSESLQSVKILADKSTVSYIFPVNKFGTFYHSDYLKVFIKRGIKNILVPEVCIVKELDVTGTNVKITVSNFPILKDDSLDIYNTVHYYKNIVKRTTTELNPWKRDILLKKVEIIPNTGTTTDLRLVPCGSAHDFDIFFNGYQLIPEVHYGLVDSSLFNDGFPILRFYFNVPVNTTYSLKIFKNESVPRSQINTVSRKAIPVDGLIVREQLPNFIPFMANLGHCFIAGKYVNNNKLTIIQRNVIRVDSSTKAVNDFFYQTRIVYTYGIKEIINYSRNSTNEYDQVLSLVGADFVRYRLNEDNVNKIIPDNLFKNKTFSDYCGNMSIVFNGSKGSTDSSNLEAYSLVRPDDFSSFVIDTNLPLTELSELSDYFSEGLLLDTNLLTEDEDEIHQTN